MDSLNASAVRQPAKHPMMPPQDNVFISNNSSLPEGSYLVHTVPEALEVFQQVLKAGEK